MYLRRTHAERRKMDYHKALRKKKLDKSRSCDGVLLFTNLHQYSKNKIHCSCCLCRGKDYRGRHILTRQEIRMRDKTKSLLKEE